jgi:hypothetical protein
MNNEYRKASEIISSLFSSFDSNGMSQSNSFLKSWKEIVGENISAHTKVIDVDKGIVIVEVDHPGWSQKILFKKKQILYELSINYPDLKIRNVIMRVVSECKTPYIKQQVKVGEGIPRVEESVTDVVLPENMNEELKAVLEKLKKSIKKGKPL